MNNLPGLASNRNPPVSASQVARITGVGQWHSAENRGLSLCPDISCLGVSCQNKGPQAQAGSARLSRQEDGPVKVTPLQQRKDMNTLDVTETPGWRP
jgi:hypothetical protein